MADEALIESLKATVHFEQKVQLVSQFEPTVVSIFLPVELPAKTGDQANDILLADAAIKEAFWIAKAHVFEQAGLKFEDRDGVLVAVIEKHFPQSQEAAAPRGGGSGAGGGGSNRPAPAAGVPDECPGCGATDLWDNRPKKASGEVSANYPDFKCKDRDCAKGIWLKKKGK